MSLNIESNDYNSISDRLAFLLESSVSDLDKSNDKTTKFEEAIQAYEDEKLTGLTKEEKEKIKKEIAEFMENNNLKMPDDHEALVSFIEGLLQKYGFKGDIEEYAESFLLSDGDAAGNKTQQEDTVSKIVEAYNNMKNIGIRI